MHRRDRVRRQHQLDPVAMRVDLRIRQAARLRVDQLREPVPHQLHPLHPRQRRATRHEPSRLRRCHVLADRSPIHPHTRRDIGLGPTRMPMLQNLHHIDHVERSPCHHTSLLVGARGLRGQGTELVDPPPLTTTLKAVEYLNVETVDYLNATPTTRWIT